MWCPQKKSLLLTHKWTSSCNVNLTADYKYWLTQKIVHITSCHCSRLLAETFAERTKIFFKEMPLLIFTHRGAVKQQGTAELSHCITLLHTKSSTMLDWFKKPAVLICLLFFGLPDSLCLLTVSKHSNVYSCSIAITCDENPLQHLTDASLVPSSLWWCWWKQVLAKCTVYMLWTQMIQNTKIKVHWKKLEKIGYIWNSDCDVYYDQHWSNYSLLLWSNQLQSGIMLLNDQKCTFK